MGTQQSPQSLLHGYSEYMEWREFIAATRERAMSSYETPKKVCKRFEISLRVGMIRSEDFVKIYQKTHSWEQTENIMFEQRSAIEPVRFSFIRYDDMIELSSS